MTGDTLHLGCGEDYRRDAVNVDQSTAVRADMRFDIGDTPWPLADGSFGRIIANHIVEHLPDVAAVLSECRRVLQSGGTASVVVPIGQNARADPDHKHIWMWKTPTMYCGARHWDVDVGLTVQQRDVTLWTTLPGIFGTLHRATLRARLAYYGQGPWCFEEPHTGGEFTVVFEK
jgi:SAM-dependent methyltransferase